MTTAPKAAAPASTTVAAICSCSAYMFPHRCGGGKCENTFWATRTTDGKPWVTVGTVCACCGEPAETKRMDIGMGRTEYWGSVSNDVHWIEATLCCEAEAVPADERSALENWRKPEPRKNHTTGAPA